MLSLSNQNTYSKSVYRNSENPVNDEIRRYKMGLFDLQYGVNSPTLATGIVKPDLQAITFNGTNQYLNMDKDAPMIACSCDKFSITAWIKPKITSNQRNICSFGNAASGGTGFSFGITTLNRLFFRTLGDSLIVPAGAAFSTEKWYFVVFIRTLVSGVYRHVLAIDNDIKSNAEKSFPTLGGTTFKIGAQDNGTQHFFEGDIDDLRIYKRDLSLEEVTALYNYRET